MQTEKFCEMRDAFSTLADVCFKLSEKNKIPRPDEIAVGCENVLRRHCLDCSKYQNCRDFYLSHRNQAEGIGNGADQYNHQKQWCQISDAETEYFFTFKL